MTRRTHVLVTFGVAALLTLAVPAVATETPPSTPLGSSMGVRYLMGPAQYIGTLPDAFAKGAQASCDQGWKGLGGGQDLGADAQQGIADAWMIDDKDWSVVAWQREAEQFRLKSYAVCVRTGELGFDSVVVPDIPPATPVAAGVLCTEGSAVGGALTRTGDPSEFALSSSYPFDGADPDTIPDDGWQAHVDYTGAGGETVHFGVHCLQDTALIYRSTKTQVAPGSSTYAKALCPKGNPVLGGGVFVTGASGLSHLVASRPWDSKDTKKVPEDGWRGGVFNTSVSKLSMTVHAVCRGAAPN